MTLETDTDARVQKPSMHFDEPHEVLLDTTLSRAQKLSALSTLEQDARQLAAASSEGMTGGERSKLQEVLSAQNMLKSVLLLNLPPGSTRPQLTP
jgi:hypothetical protein